MPKERHPGIARKGMPSSKRASPPQASLKPGTPSEGKPESLSRMTAARGHPVDWQREIPVQNEKAASGKPCGSPCPAVVALPPVTAPCPAFPKQNPRRHSEWKGHPIPSTALSGCAGPKALSERAAHLPCGQTPQDGPKSPTVRQTAHGCEEKHARQTPRQAGKGLILWDGGLTGHGGGVPLRHHENPRNRAQDAAQKSVEPKTVSHPASST